MVQRITPVKILSVSKDGECHLTITLELNINLTANGEVGASLKGLSAPAEKTSVKEEDDDAVDFTVPDFLSGMKLDFGKSVD